LIVGEAPGKEEHVRGRPFVGWAGSFLRAELARHLDPQTQEKIFLTNAFRLWPICSHRRPTPDKAMVDSHRFLLTNEIATCRELQAILAVGRIALYAVTGNAAYFDERVWPMRNLIARRHSSAPGLIQGTSVEVIAVYHPRFVRSQQQNKGVLRAWRRGIARLDTLV
jgi:uracil-DNA glycosylase family 4